MDEKNEPVVLEDEGSLEASVAELAAARKTQFDQTKLILPGAILLAAVMISGSLLYVNANRGTAPADGPDEQLPAVEATVDDDPVLGNSGAEVTIIEFSDYQCPFCRRFWSETLPLLRSQYIDTGKAKLVYRDFPLPFHPMAQPSAEAAECAEDQGRYWEMHDKIFAEQQLKGEGTVEYTLADLKKWARAIGLNGSQFDQCMDTRKHQAEVEKDLSDGSASGVSGTPSFFINGTLLVGAQPFSEFQRLIDAALK